MIPTHVFNSMILTDNPCTQLVPSNSIKPIEVTYCKNTLYNTCINQQYQIQQMLNKYQDIEQNLNGQISKDNTKMQNDINCFLHLRPHNQQIYLHQEWCVAMASHSDSATSTSQSSESSSTNLKITFHLHNSVQEDSTMFFASSASESSKTSSFIVIAAVDAVPI
mgnify:CR=1 FL=1